MTVYVEQENGYLVDGNRTIPNSIDNPLYNQILQEVIDLESTITTYAGSADELADAIAIKVGEINAEFTNRHNVILTNAVMMDLYYAPLDPPTPDSTKYHADISVAGVAIVFVSALLDVATVNAYDAAVDPSWTP